ncbi:MAG: hypothetical protein AB1Z98_39135, partial [Nannocystaceae bacterium]
MSIRADVVIITAADGEDTALLEVSDGVSSGWQEIDAPEAYPTKVYAAELESLVEPGRSLRVVTSRPPWMGGDFTSHVAGQLVNEFKPQCIAMCGVCAGRPGWTQLGDVIIGDRVWRYDTGARVNETKGGRPRFKRDTTVAQLSPEWLRAVEDAAKEWTQWPGGDSAWLDSRPRTIELQGLWLLQQLANGRHFADVADDPQTDRFCAAWKDVADELQRRGHVDAGEVTDKGRKHLQKALFDNRNRLPEPDPWALHVGPIATGNHLVEDIDIWDLLENEQRLVRGLEMEIATIGQAAWMGENRFLAAKGVMDFALPERHRGFRPFAARASAEVLLRLLRTLVLPVPVETVTSRPGDGIENLGERPSVFEGRTDELEAIRQALASDGAAAVFPAIVGLGGVGKSRLALEYAFERKNDFDIRWRVRAGKVASLHEDLAALGEKLGLFGEFENLEHAANGVLEWLSTHERWLLVL